MAKLKQPLKPEVTLIDRLTKAHIKALEKVHLAQTESRLPLQSTAKVYEALQAIGYVEQVTQSLKGVIKTGWSLTQAGRITLCLNYELGDFRVD